LYDGWSYVIVQDSFQDRCLPLDARLSPHGLTKITSAELTSGAVEDPVIGDRPTKPEIAWRGGVPNSRNLRAFFDQPEGHAVKPYISFHVYPRDRLVHVLTALREFKEAAGDRVVPELHLENPK
jgi:hypothetical protein